MGKCCIQWAFVPTWKLCPLRALWVPVAFVPNWNLDHSLERPVCCLSGPNKSELGHLKDLCQTLLKIINNPMTMGLVQNISNHNKRNTVNNDLTNVPCKRWWYSHSHLHGRLLVISKNYSMLKQQCLLKHNNFLENLQNSQTK